MKITRDEAPYFIEFEDDSVQAVQELLTTLTGKHLHEPYIGGVVKPFRSFEQIVADAISMEKPIFHITSYDPEQAKQILSLIPMAKPMSLSPFRTTLFIVPPGFNYTPHKDGADLKCGINIPLYIKDDRCVTSWFAEEDIGHLPMKVLKRSGVTREVENFDSAIHKPAHSFTMRPDRAVLFNTDVYHSFHNDSPDWRIIMTLRPLITSLNFETAAQRLRKVCS